MTATLRDQVATLEFQILRAYDILKLSHDCEEHLSTCTACQEAGGTCGAYDQMLNNFVVLREQFLSENEDTAEDFDNEDFDEDDEEELEEDDESDED